MKVSFPTTTTVESDAIHRARTTPLQSPERKAAQEFEQIFVRKMLSSLEKTGRMGQSGSVSGGNDVYSSMVVDGLANAIAGSGGIGLADLIVRSMHSHDPAAPSAATVDPASAGGSAVSAGTAGTATAASGALAQASGEGRSASRVPPATSESDLGHTLATQRQFGPANYGGHK